MVSAQLRPAVPINCKDPTVTPESYEWLAPSFEIVGCHFAN